MKKILITGVTGQDGHYLADEAHNQGFSVYGMIRGQDNPKVAELTAERPWISLVQGDLVDGYSIRKAVEAVRPEVIVNLGAISFVPLSWLQPELTFKVNALGVLNLLNACQEYGIEHFIQASTSEMFGNAGGFLNEDSPMNPVSPYGISKLTAHQFVLNYRSAYKMNAVSAIMFNHESPRRGPQFVTQKIAKAAARLKVDPEGDFLTLGNLSAKRDWGYSPEYMRGLLKITNYKYGELNPSYVFATGETASVEDFANAAFSSVGLDWKRCTIVDPGLKRVNELQALRGNSARALRDLGWSARTTWKSLAALMTNHELMKLKAKEQVPA